MQIETPNLSDLFPPRKHVVEPSNDIEQTDENAELEWLLSRRMQEPIIWPRILPGL